jgi:hypothetical protein
MVKPHIDSLIKEIDRLQRMQRENMYTKTQVINIATNACMSAVYTVLTSRGYLLSDVEWNELNEDFREDLHMQVKAVVKTVLR